VLKYGKKRQKRARNSKKTAENGWKVFQKVSHTEAKCTFAVDNLSQENEMQKLASQKSVFLNRAVTFVLKNRDERGLS
jgi:hypothetical protein